MHGELLQFGLLELVLHGAGSGDKAAVQRAALVCFDLATTGLLAHDVTAGKERRDGRYYAADAAHSNGQAAAPGR
ncbi:hypothetical protein MTO96_046472 [Rhipicephalus appendiculatus]